MNRPQAFDLVTKLESFLVWGSSTAQRLAPEKAPAWNRALFFVRVARSEMERSQEKTKDRRR